jgi:hypothetical protein
MVNAVCFQGKVRQKKSLRLVALENKNMTYTLLFVTILVKYA